ncbi:MAG: DNA topoisomerase I, partial [Candidatus Hydrothermarchaeales archaeon]
MKLIITEKPKVSQRIAQSIADKYTKKRDMGVSYYEVRANGAEVVIASAAGHLYSLKQVKGGWGYPVFDVEWVPLSEIDRSKSYVEKYIQLLSKLSREADEFYLATDYDIEGELLGYNALKFACSLGDRKVLRMKFSALTRSDLLKAFQEPIDVDLKLAAAGEARHIMDWYWGINTSRALGNALRSVKGRAIVSAGRVQTPALAILVQREREINTFVSRDYWEILAELDVKGMKVKAQHIAGKIFDEARSKQVLEDSRCDVAIVKEAIVKQVQRLAPYPFDLGTLQGECWRIFRLSPKRTQQIAQSLYEGGYISYPRTASQKLPPAIGYKRILMALGKAQEFRGYVDAVLQKPTLRPRQGNKTDPAHPAIYPTGALPKRLSPADEKVYKLVVHRFIAVFGDPLIREQADVKCLLNKEEFEFQGTRTLEEGWLPLYPYFKLKELHIPELVIGEELRVLRIYPKEGKTQPPDRFNQSSLVKELEKRSLGTKATRADIVDTLFRRDYIQGSPIEVTELGLSVVGALEEHVPEIISEELTRAFEDKIERIQRGEESKESVLEEAKNELTRILREFKGKEEDIG